MQGVGFRATAREIVHGSGLSLTGWVKNEPDGTVSMVLDGEDSDVERALGELRSVMRGCIAGEVEEPADAREQLEGFEVRR